MKRVIPPVYFLVAILSMVALHITLPLRLLLAFPWQLIGVLPLAGGALLTLTAARSFARHKTAIKPFEKSSALVTVGVFSQTRNPMYLGLVSALAGLATLLGSASPWVVVPVFALLLDRVFIRAEESLMESTFGDAFRAYRARVRRWV